MFIYESFFSTGQFKAGSSILAFFHRIISFIVNQSIQVYSIYIYLKILKESLKSKLKHLSYTLLKLIFGLKMAVSMLKILDPSLLFSVVINMPCNYTSFLFYLD